MWILINDYKLIMEIYIDWTISKLIYVNFFSEKMFNSCTSRIQMEIPLSMTSIVNGKSSIDDYIFPSCESLVQIIILSSINLFGRAVSNHENQWNKLKFILI